MSEYQTKAANAFSHLGLARGRKGSSATHIEIQELYDLTLEPLRALPVWNMKPPSPARNKPKEPSLTERFGKKMATYEEDVKCWEEENLYREKYYLEMDKFHKEQIGTIKPYMAKAGQVSVLEKMIENLKESNSKLTRHAQSFSPIHEQYKSTPLPHILKKIYGAEEIPSKSIGNKKIEFNISGRRFYIIKDSWEEIDTKNSGRGAVSLVAHLEEIPAEKILDTVPIIASHFGYKQATTDLCIHYINIGESQAKRRMDQPFPIPKNAHEKLEHAIIFLVGTCKIPKEIVKNSIDNGLVFVDTLDNLVFPRPSGGFTRQPMKLNRNGNQVNRKEQLVDPEPYYINSKVPGDQELIVAINELEALALAAQFPDAQIIVLNRCSCSKSFQHLREAKKIVLSFDLNQENTIDKDILSSFEKNGIFSDVVIFKLPSDILSGCSSWINLLRKSPDEKSKININSEISVNEGKSQGIISNKFGPGM
jgi:hypothetical protein